MLDPKLMAEYQKQQSNNKALVTPFVTSGSLNKSTSTGVVVTTLQL